MAATDATELIVTSKRLVPRRVVGVTVLQPDGSLAASFDCLAGSNLRGELLRRGIRVYDPDTRRFDNPWGVGDCAGDGLCGTCLVEVRSGDAACSPLTAEEGVLLANRPARWRLSCRMFVGKDNARGDQVRARCIACAPHALNLHGKNHVASLGPPMSLCAFRPPCTATSSSASGMGAGTPVCCSLLELGGSVSDAS